MQILFAYPTQTILWDTLLNFSFESSEGVFISSGTIFQIFGPEYDMDSNPFYTVFADI